MDPTAGLETSPLVYVAACAVCVVLVAIALRQRRQSVAERVRKCAPLAAFFTDFTKQDISERRLAHLFDPNVFKTMQRVTLKALNRCVVHELGPFQKMQQKTCRLSARTDAEGTTRYRATATCDFEKSKGVPCEMTWLLATSGNSYRVLVVSFRARPVDRDLDVMKYVEPAEYEGFGERFIATILSKSPDDAFDAMTPSLQQGIGADTALQSEMKTVLQAMGGLKDRHLEVGMSNASMIAIGSGESKTRALLLEYIVQGNARDVRVTLTCVFSGLKTLVIKYVFTGLHLKQKQVVVDENGRTLTL
jgi:hypothetical protein